MTSTASEYYTDPGTAKRAALEQVAREVIMDADGMGEALDWDAEVSDEKFYESLAREALDEWLDAHGGEFDRSNEGVRELLAHIMASFDEQGMFLEPATTDLFEEMPKQDAIKPIERHDPTTKLAQKFCSIVPGRKTRLNVSGSKEKQKVVTAVQVLCGDNISVGKGIEPYDMEVQYGVISLWCAGVRVFTAAQVCGAMNGNDGRKASQNQISDVEESLEKQRMTLVTIDYTGEARGRKLTDSEGIPVKEFTEDEPMLSFKRQKIEFENGRRGVGYVLKSEPVLYSHAVAVNQIATYPVALLDTSSAGSNTRNNIAIKGYLLRRIKLAKNGNLNQKRIKYKTVFENVGMNRPTDKQRQAALKYMRGCMDVWKSQGFIKSWGEYRSTARGRKIEGLEFKF